MEEDSKITTQEAFSREKSVMKNLFDENFIETIAVCSLYLLIFPFLASLNANKANELIQKLATKTEELFNVSNINEGFMAFYNELKTELFSCAKIQQDLFLKNKNASLNALNLVTDCFIKFISIAFISAGYKHESEVIQFFNKLRVELYHIPELSYLQSKLLTKSPEEVATGTGDHPSTSQEEAKEIELKYQKNIKQEALKVLAKETSKGQEDLLSVCLKSPELDEKTVNINKVIETYFLGLRSNRLEKISTMEELNEFIQHINNAANISPDQWTHVFNFIVEFGNQHKSNQLKSTEERIEEIIEKQKEGI
jgi:hypothetical protein